MAEISFTVSPHDAEVIGKIADRTMAMYEALGAPARLKNRMSVRMDVTACHANGNPLRLDALLAADDFNFAHDVFGIRDHIDRTTGELTGFFSPRFSKQEV